MSKLILTELFQPSRSWISVKNEKKTTFFKENDIGVNEASEK